MAHIEKHYGTFNKEDFVDAFRCAYDWPLFTYRGQDYVIDQKYHRKTGEREYFFADPLIHRGEGHRLSIGFETVDELLAAPVLDGKSFLDRYDTLLVADEYSCIY